MEIGVTVFQAEVVFGLTYCAGTSAEMGARRALRQNVCIQLHTQGAPLAIAMERGMIQLIGPIEAAREWRGSLGLERDDLELLLQSAEVKQWPPVVGEDIEEAIVGIQAYLQEQLNTLQTMEMIERLPASQRDAALAKLQPKEAE